MDPDSLSFLDTALALIPILIILILMIGFRWSGARAGGVAWLAAVLVSVIGFGAGWQVLVFSQLKALFFTLFVLYIIWMAIALYHVLREAGAIVSIAHYVARLTGSRILQLLLMSWVFSSFLGGMSGFGVPIAVVAPILVSLGFSPITSVIAVASGHSWAVTFGGIGAPFNALVVTTGITGDLMAPSTAVLLGVACLACGIAAAHSYRGFASIRRGIPALLIVAATMSSLQYLLARIGMWNLGALIPAMGGLLSIVLVRHLPTYRAMNRPQDTEAIAIPNPLPFPLAAAPYLCLVIIFLSATLIQPVHDFLGQVQLSVTFPGFGTSRGWFNPASQSIALSLFGHAGALLAYTSLIAYFMFQRAGLNQPGAFRRLLTDTASSAGVPSLGIAVLVGTAMIMDQSGMSFALAVGLSRIFEPIYPLLAPFIGLLGSFTTNSNLSSNVLFGGLQKDAAELLNLPVAAILAAQTAGGSLGSMISPAKVILGCSTVGLAGKEGLVIRRTSIYVLLISTLVGAVTWLLAR